jgi:hypothetical protein
VLHERFCVVVESLEEGLGGCFARGFFPSLLACMERRSSGRVRTVVIERKAVNGKKLVSPQPHTHLKKTPRELSLPHQTRRSRPHGRSLESSKSPCLVPDQITAHVATVLPISFSKFADLFPNARKCPSHRGTLWPRTNHPHKSIPPK